MARALLDNARLVGHSPEGAAIFVSDSEVPQMPIGPVSVSDGPDDPHSLSRNPVNLLVAIPPVYETGFQDSRAVRLGLELALTTEE
jgi:hypothetical protein